MAIGTIGFNKLRVITTSEEDELVGDSPSVFETELTTLTLGQRVTLAIVVSILCICSVFGNVGTLYANKTRKLRVFFRTCLISLALSDLITSVFTSVAYLAQFGAPSVQIWCIGEILCKMIPVLTTGAILVSSMTLLGIAFDRYYAVMKAGNGFWQPNLRCSLVITVLIWSLSFTLAFHVFFAYSVYQVYIITEVDEGVFETYLASMCVSPKEANAYYYLVVLAIIFVPTLVAFVWLNSIIANKLWIRRHSFKSPPPPTPSPTIPRLIPLPSPMPPSLQPASQLRPMPAAPMEPKEKQMEMIPQQYPRHKHHHQDHHHRPPQQQQGCQRPCHCRGDNKICISSTLTVPTSLAPSSSTGTPEAKSPRSSNPQPGDVGAPAVAGLGNKAAKHISSREARHLRMFTIVLILMAVFIFFRLPAWIFLIMRMYGTYTHRIDWILHFSFGILTLTSCVLNPLLYTFLAETIRYAMFMKGKLCGLRRYFRDLCCYCCLLWCFNDNKMTQNQHQNANQNDKDNGDNPHAKPHANPKANVNTNDNASDSDSNDCTSNDGAKSTSKKSDDDSKVNTIIPVAPERPRNGCHAKGGGKRTVMEEEDAWCQC